jgi:hypothetical protein
MPEATEVIRKLKKLRRLHPSWSTEEAVIYLHDHTPRLSKQWDVIDPMYERLREKRRKPPFLKNPNGHSKLTSANEAIKILSNALPTVLKLANQLILMAGGSSDQFLGKKMVQAIERYKNRITVSIEDYETLQISLFGHLLGYQEKNESGFYSDDKEIYFLSPSGEEIFFAMVPQHKIVSFVPEQIILADIKIALKKADEFPSLFKLKFIKYKSNPRSKMGRAAQKRISQKIAFLIREGYAQDQAAAIAYSYERKGKLGPRGGIKKNPIEDRELAPSIAFLLYLNRMPHMYENVPDKYMKIFRDEGFWDDDDCRLTDKGKEFIEKMMKDI